MCSGKVQKVRLLFVLWVAFFFRWWCDREPCHAVHGCKLFAEVQTERETRRARSAVQRHETFPVIHTWAKLIQSYLVKGEPDGLLHSCF